MKQWNTVRDGAPSERRMCERVVPRLASVHNQRQAVAAGKGDLSGEGLALVGAEGKGRSGSRARTPLSRPAWADPAASGSSVLTPLVASWG